MQGKVDDLPDDDDSSWALQVTAGNATELRKMSDLLLVDPVTGHDLQTSSASS